jgi:hypothetical protein
MGFKRGSICIQFSMTGQEKGDLLIQVTVYHICILVNLPVFKNFELLKIVIYFLTKIFFRLPQDCLIYNLF